MNLRNALAHARAGDLHYYLWKVNPALLRAWLRLRGMSATEAYSAMQKTVYEARARTDPKAFVVGMYEWHERYDYETELLRHGPGADAVALDFGCGPGRMIRRMATRLARVDGVDIAEENLRAAREYCGDLPVPPVLHLTAGRDLAEIPSATYDLVYSTICLQHIPVHSIRNALVAEMYRVLRPGGRLALQMAQGESVAAVTARASSAEYPAHFAGWGDDATSASDTNGLHDVVVTPGDHATIERELSAIGFRDVSFATTPPPHPTHYLEWLYLYATKPGDR
ncbi:MAG: methyltransferase domain-containing protein [Gemmatimonadaceae bacterium]|nr:methyltransferase domain-containing protein [Gemmatimonadaceae bacterium]